MEVNGCFAGGDGGCCRCTTRVLAKLWQNFIHMMAKRGKAKLKRDSVDI